jgi:hypothetical protein
MPRGFSTSTVAHAIGAPVKWLDNVLTHHDVAGAEGRRQGVPRRITPDAVMVLLVARRLSEELGANAELALRAARVSVAEGSVRIEKGVTLVVDSALLGERLSGHLLDAVEAAPPRKRGRPSGRQPATRDSIG